MTKQETIEQEYHKEQEILSLQASDVLTDEEWLDENYPQDRQA